MADCPSREQLSAYLLDELSVEECQVVDAHVSGCGTCEAVMADLCEELALGRAPTAQPILAKNLLFGLLALHNSFISREDLVSATGAWLEDKSQLLAEILVARDQLTEEDCKLVAALVEKHFEKYGHDLNQSMASVSSLSSVQEDFEGFGDPDINASLGLLPKSGFSSEPGMPRPISAVDLKEGERFETLYAHAKGGLGEIFVAHDRQLDRNVALKRMQERHARSQLSRIRFELEAEVTGKLEHPGIVPVYSRGADAEGRPFYAMRFIRGNTLKEEIDEFHKAVQGRWRSREGRLRLQGLLRRLIDICNAIEYAHHRGVLHRDLKPANIMLGRFGETMVVDWGLAKTSEPLEVGLDRSPAGEPVVQLSGGSATGPTTLGTVVGTLGYMSPEQASGRPEDVNALSDIYSLGAILYRLLTGQASQESHIDKLGILERIENGEFPRPRAIRPEIPPPLESICLKAMSVNPADRYASARLLAEDIEAWMADEKVDAHREGVAEKSLRLIRRYRGAVAATVGLALIAAATSVAFFAVRDASRSQRQSALFVHKVREVVDVWLTGASSELRDIPGALPLRKQLLRRAISEFELLESEDYDSIVVPPLEVEQGLTLLRQGEVEVELGEFKAAEQSFLRAKHSFQQLPNNREAQFYLANSLMKIGDLSDQPLQSYNDALAIYRRLCSRDSADEYAHDALGASLLRIGETQLADSKLKEAEETLILAVAEFEKATSMSQLRDGDNGSDQEVFRQGLCHANNSLGDAVLRQPLRANASAPYFATAMKISSELNSRHPSERTYIELHTDSKSYYANMLRKLKRFDEELEQRKQVLSDYESLAEDHPRDVHLEEAVARGKLNLGQTYLLLDQLEAGKFELEVAKEMFEKLALDAEPLPRYRVQLAASMDLFAQIQNRLGNSRQARILCQDAAAIFLGLAGEAESNDSKHRRANNLRTCGEIEHELGNSEQARIHLDRSIELLRSLDAADEYDQYQEDLTKSLAAKRAISDGS